MIQIFSNSMGSEELAAVQAVFNSKWLGFGKETQQFQEELGAKIGSFRTLCVNSATSACFMAMRILDIGPGDEVIIASVNFVGCANAIIDRGAIPVFADVDSRYLNMAPAEISRLRTKRTKAILLLHYGGHPADMDAIWREAGDLPIIEDSCCAPFSTYKGRNCGTLGDIGFFSFDPMKILVVGDGGAIILKNDVLLNRAKEIRYMGVANRQSGIDGLKTGTQRWWEIELNTISGRFVPNDITSAIGRVQLRRVDGFIARRKEIWDFYQRELAGCRGLSCPPEPLPGTTSSYYLYWLTVPERRDALAAWLTSKGIYCTFRYFPLHLIKHYGSRQRLPNSESANETTLNIPLHQNLQQNEIESIVRAVREFFG
ncbi:MAG: DegT/DnrJ/EryC1/StrS family aminotransferase [Kiritimatiellae bacterium]|nr:DegT/DnrJ/EryC1/StrS family aminotransferase [Kiritimatiellia bacterium]